MAQPGGTGAIGPFPPGVDDDAARDDYDRLRRRVLWKMPSGLFVIGARAGDRRNGMTANWVSQVSFAPKLVAVSIEHEALTHELVSEGRVFSVNMVAVDDRAVVRKFTKPVEAHVAPGGTTGTLNGLAFHDGPTGAPVLDQAVAWLDCEVSDTVEVGGHTLFVGEVVDCGFQHDEDTPVLSMADTRMNYGG